MPERLIKNYFFNSWTKPFTRALFQGLTSGGGHHQLVESQALSAGVDDFGSSSLSEPEGGNGELGYIKKSIVISDGSDDHGDFVLSVQQSDELVERHGRPVGSGGHESSQHSFSEGGVSSSGEEPEELDEQVLVQVGAPGVLLVGAPNSTSLH